MWLYLAGVSRDGNVFEDVGRFHFDRFMNGDGDGRPHGFALGAEPKTCLGVDTVRRIVATVIQELIEAGTELEGAIYKKGVKGWLEWEDVASSAIAEDLRQLPCQRPRGPIIVSVRAV